MRREQPSWWDAELVWYFQSCEGDMGVRGIDPERQMQQYATRTSGLRVLEHDGIDDTQVRAVTRARHVAAALATLTETQRTLLGIAHTYVSPRVSLDMRRARDRVLETRTTDLAIAVVAWRRAWERERAGRRAA